MLDLLAAATIFAMAEEVLRKSWLEKIGLDWGAVIVAGVFVVLAVANVLPRIPW
ncbi:MAG: hypothetical protein QOH60_4677 [Mycobacterium sp.]|nr:hypothetical protein [Mycobacterium sp.]